MSKSNMPYIAIVESKEVNSMTNYGDRFLLLEGINGSPIKARGIPYKPTDLKRTDLKIFKSYKKAEKFINQWKGYPYICKPNGQYQILKVKPTYQKILDGYQIIN